MYVEPIYPAEVEIMNVTHTLESASYRYLDLDFDNECRLSSDLLGSI